MARSHSASLTGELRFAKNGVFAVTWRVEDKANVTGFAVTKCIQEQGGVLGGPLQLQIMELRKRGLMFDAIAKAARARKVAPCGGACVVCCPWGANPT